MRTHFPLILLVSAFIACQSASKAPAIPFNKYTSSYSNFDSVTCTKLDWTAKVDFEKKQIVATAVWHFKNTTNAPTIRLDTYDLSIHKVLVN